MIRLAPDSLGDEINPAVISMVFDLAKWGTASVTKIAEDVNNGRTNGDVFEDAIDGEALVPPLDLRETAAKIA